MPFECVERCVQPSVRRSTAVGGRPVQGLHLPPGCQLRVSQSDVALMKGKNAALKLTEWCTPCWMKPWAVAIAALKAVPASASCALSARDARSAVLAADTSRARSASEAASSMRSARASALAARASCTIEQWCIGHHRHERYTSVHCSSGTFQTVVLTGREARASDQTGASCKYAADGLLAAAWRWWPRQLSIWRPATLGPAPSQARGMKQHPIGLRLMLLRLHADARPSHRQLRELPNHRLCSRIWLFPTSCAATSSIRARRCSCRCASTVAARPSAHDVSRFSRVLCCPSATTIAPGWPHLQQKTAEGV